MNALQSKDLDFTINMDFIIIGIGIGCWMYAFVNHRWNDIPWTSSKLFFWLGLIAIVIGSMLVISA